MIVKYVKCDNPQCKNVAPSESDEVKDRKPYAPPYGWIRLKGFKMGSGPTNINLDVCSSECATPAIARIIEEYFENR